MSQKPIVAILLSEAPRAAELARRLAAEEVEPLVSQGSDDLYRLLNQQRVDLVVIQNELQGFLRGLEILQRLYGDLLRPATVLLAEASSDVQRQAREMGIDQIVRPDETLDALAAGIKGILAASRHGQVLIPMAARKLVQHSDTIRPLPQLLVKMSGYLDDPSASVDALARDIAVDPKITAELLKLTNSSALGLRQKVTRVADAVKFLGTRRTVSLVLSATVVDAQSGLLRALPEAMQHWYNARSVLMASTAATFAQHLEGVSPETAYILGLLQDIGLVILAQSHGERYLQLVGRARSIGPLRLEICEREEFGLTHADISAALLQKWMLPSSLVALVLHHHQDPAGDCSKTEQKFLHAVRIGEAVANLSDKPCPQRYQQLNQLLAAFEGSGEQCRACLAEAVGKAAESSQLFSIPVPDAAQLSRVLQRISASAAEDEAATAEPAADTDPPAAESSSPDDLPAVPVSEAPTEPSAAPTSMDSPPAGSPWRVLVVEDDPLAINAVRLVLETAGVEVVGCRTGQEALAQAAEVTAILCDIHLADETGVTLIRELRQAGFSGAIIALTGDRTRQTVESCIAAGVDDYLLKPFRRRTLLDALARHAGLTLEPASLSA